MADEGHRTAMVERKWLGGSCPNVACLPSKNLIYSDGWHRWRGAALNSD